MKSIKYIIIIFSIIIGLIIITINSDVSNTTNKYKKNWDIGLPNDIELIYCEKSNIGFNGDGTYYEIYNISKESIYKISDSWIDNRTNDVEECFKERLSNLGVPKSQYPKFTEKYLFKKLIDKEDERDYLIMLYQNGKIYMLIDLS